MKLDNHIVRKVRENPTDFTIEVLEALKGGEISVGDIESDRYSDILHTLSNKDNKTYYVTKSVIDRLELLDTKKCMDVEGWKLFKGLPDFKKTYILPEGTGMCEHWMSNDGKSLAPFLYTLMCFVELCDNEIIVVEQKAKYGTKKSGKIINTLPCPITIINNNWNITKVIKGTTVVVGHAQIYWIGQGRILPKLLYKEPFTKGGRTIRSGKELEKS